MSTLELVHLTRHPVTATRVNTANYDKSNSTTDAVQVEAYLQDQLRDHLIISTIENENVAKTSGT